MVGKIREENEQQFSYLSYSLLDVSQPEAWHYCYVLQAAGF